MSYFQISSKQIPLSNNVKYIKIHTKSLFETVIYRVYRNVQNDKNKFIKIKYNHKFDEASWHYQVLSNNQTCTHLLNFIQRLKNVYIHLNNKNDVVIAMTQKKIRYFENFVSTSQDSHMRFQRIFLITVMSR